MQKQNARTLLIILVVLASMFSYIYINTVEPIVTEQGQTEYQLMEDDDEKKKEALSSSNLRLPEVTLLKKVIETGKSLMPGN